MDFQVRVFLNPWHQVAQDIPETKVLKQRVRDHIDPSRDLGHSDKHGKKEEQPETEGQEELATKKETSGATVIKFNPDGTVCEDCR